MKVIKAVLAVILLAVALAPIAGTAHATPAAQCPNRHQVCVTVPVYGWRNGQYVIIRYDTRCHWECGL